jgi:hypothetical protein
MVKAKNRIELELFEFALAGCRASASDYSNVTSFWKKFLYVVDIVRVGVGA